MKAMIYKAPYQLAIEDVPIPELRPGHALVKVKACGICGSDVHGFTGETGRRSPGVIMGHEFSGQIEAVAEDITRFSVGDRVVVEPVLSCGKCSFCQKGHTQFCIEKKCFGVLDENGAYAEYIAVPEYALLPLPEGMSYEEGALIEPLAFSTFAVDRVADYRGKTVVIVGAGTIGLMTIAVLKARGATCIIMAGRHENRLNAAKALGADHVIDTAKVDTVTEVMRLTDGIGADVSFDAVGLGQAVDDVMACLHKEGTAVWMGIADKTINLDMQRVVTGGLQIHGAFTYTNKSFEETVREYTSMNIPSDILINKTISLDEAPETFANLASKKDKSIKTIIVFD